MVSFVRPCGLFVKLVAPVCLVVVVGVFFKPVKLVIPVFVVVVLWLDRKLKVGVVSVCKPVKPVVMFAETLVVVVGVVLLSRFPKPVKPVLLFSKKLLVVGVAVAPITFDWLFEPVLLVIV